MLTMANCALGAASSNTLVRFQLRNGTTVFGNIDVELFDHDKPITVSNFLHYVRSSAFDHSILHRAIPDFIVQGGLYTVPNPYLPTAANYMNRIPEGTAIANEATMSPIIPNTFGTLAMALSAGSGPGPDLNSATTSWYFNTGNNTDDLTEYTVFGKVKSGSWYLSSFNKLSEDEGIINMYGQQYVLHSTCDLLTIDSFTNVGLSELPVAYKFFDCPFNSDLFTVTISVLSSATNNLDSTAPLLTIDFPSNNGTVSNSTITAAGTVSDNVAIKTLAAYTGFGTRLTPTIQGNTWSLALSNLPSGNNSILLEADDHAGNRTTVRSTYFHEVLFQITIPEPSGTGHGTTHGITNGQLLVIGRPYSITAKADPTNFFVGWLKNSFMIDLNPTHRFLMETGKLVYAQFDTNQFPYVKGTYNGLFASTNSVEQQSSGYFTLTLGDSGSYSAKLIMNGDAIPFTGRFTTRGANSAFLFGPRGLPGRTQINMNIDLFNPDNQLCGIVTNSYAYLRPIVINTNIIVGTNIVNTNVIVTIPATNNWSAVLIADRVSFNSKLNPAPQAGKYTMIIPAETNSPAGDGYGTVTVTSAGGITFAGVLADGTKATQKTFLSEDGHWPLYVPLNKTNGSLVSWVNFSDEEMADFSGLFNWFNQAHVAKYYSAGFTNEATILGSRFTKPNATNQMLYLTNGTVTFTGGNLAADFTNNVTLDPKGKVTKQDANKLNFGINSGNGLVSGSATPPAGGKSISFKGAILQKQTNAAGFFLGTNASGRVYLGR